MVGVGRARGGEGAMQIVEGEQMVVDMRHPFVGDGRPAVADVDPRELEPPQERSGVDAVERRVVGELGRREAVIVGENLVEPALLDQKQGEMPAVVVGHEMRVRPVRPRRLEKADALLVPVRGLHHVGQRMRRPGVARIAGERLAAEVLGALEVAGLLEPEGVKPEDEARERIVAIPGRQDPRGAVADGGRPAEKEIGVLRQAQGERVGRVIGEDRLPADDRLRGLALRPGLGGGEMAPLALRGAPNRRFGRTERGRTSGWSPRKPPII